MSIPFTDKQARAAIAAVVTGSVGTGPKVYPYNVLNYKTDKDGRPDFGEWPGLFTYGEYGEYIHGWVIKRTAREVDLRASGCEDLDQFYDVWGYYKFNPDLDSGNSSDDVFGAIVDDVAEDFNTSSLITINGVGVLHYGLQFPSLTVLRAGQQLLHFAGGSVRLQYQT